jgi:hypothetical protein
MSLGESEEDKQASDVCLYAQKSLVQAPKFEANTAQKCNDPVCMDHVRCSMAALASVLTHTDA